jgi:hypothetical protein
MAKKPWRESVTATEQADGTISVKLHGFPLTTTGATYAEAMQRIGAFLDGSSKARKDIMRRYEESP